MYCFIFKIFSRKEKRKTTITIATTSKQTKFRLLLYNLNTSKNNMNTFFAICVLLLIIASASAFAPTLFGVRHNSVTSSNTVCYAKHVNDKAARWAKAKRPKKSRLSDIFRKKPNYSLSSIVKPSEYTIDSAPASPMVKPSKEE